MNSNAIVDVMRDRLTLPKIALQNFDGNPLSFHDFIQSFYANIDQHDYQPKTKLSHLIDRSKGPSKDSIQRWVIASEKQKAYMESRSILKRMSGRKELVVEANIKELIDTPLIQKGDIHL